jgi:phage baseplate assembly protein W
MSSISPRLPLNIDEQDGYTMNKTIIEAIKQNVKMLLLTIPGERVMDTDFGVGLKTYLFEFNDGSTYASIRARINQQIQKYMPFIQIVELEIFTPDERTPDSENSVQVIFSYRVRPTDELDSVVFNF